MDSLETERLLIRPWKTMDAQDYFSYAKSPVMAQQLALRPITTEAEAKKIVADIKDSKLKVQASIQGEQVRVSGKSRDDLQTVIQLLKKNEEKYDAPLQFTNYR